MDIAKCRYYDIITEIIFKLILFQVHTVHKQIHFHFTLRSQITMTFLLFLYDMVFKFFMIIACI